MKSVFDRKKNGNSVLMITQMRQIARVEEEREERERDRFEANESRMTSRESQTTQNQTTCKEKEREHRA